MSFHSFIHKIDSFFRKKDNDLDFESRNLARLVKIGEEYGELCKDVLQYVRAYKKNDKEHMEVLRPNMEEEFADMIITIHMLAKSMEVDIDKVVQEKMPKVEQKLGITKSE